LKKFSIYLPVRWGRKCDTRNTAWVYGTIRTVWKKMKRLFKPVSVPIITDTNSMIKQQTEVSCTASEYAKVVKDFFQKT